MKPKSLAYKIFWQDMGNYTYNSVAKYLYFVALHKAIKR